MQDEQSHMYCMTSDDACLVAVVWGMWEKFENIPKWQPWLHDVETLPDDLSKWTLSKKVCPAQACAPCP